MRSPDATLPERGKRPKGGMSEAWEASFISSFFAPGKGGKGGGKEGGDFRGCGTDAHLGRRPSCQGGGRDIGDFGREITTRGGIGQAIIKHRHQLTSWPEMCKVSGLEPNIQSIDLHLLRVRSTYLLLTAIIK